MAQHYYNREYRHVAYWADAGDGFVPPGASVIGGSDINGETIYIGRAVMDGDLIPGKVVPSHYCCYVPYAGGEHSHRTYQVLVANGCDFDWIDSSDGQVPPGALQAGSTSDGEPLFIGRHRIEGHYCIGKVHPSHGCVYLPFDGKENRFNEYEILCVRCVPL